MDMVIINCIGDEDVYGYHEIATSIENIRELISEEKRLLKERKFSLLPQFYHLPPEF